MASTCDTKPTDSDITYTRAASPTPTSPSSVGDTLANRQKSKDVDMCIADDDHVPIFESVSEVTSSVAEQNDREEKMCVDENTEHLSRPRPNTDMESSSSLNSVDQKGQPEHPGLLNEMLDYLAHSTTAYFKSQQSDEPELNFHQKRVISSQILAQNPGNFLARFGKHLKSEHLNYFKDLLLKKDDYEVAFYVQELTHFYSKPKQNVKIRNRRYEALKKLSAESSYFNEEEMKKRNPLLYEDLVGKYMTKEEIEEHEKLSESKNQTFVDVLMNQIENEQVGALLESQVEAEKDAEEEFDTSDEDSVIDTLESNEDENHVPVKRRRIGEKDLLRGEFFSYMYDSFLEGKDKDFDYSQVDDNTEYDNLTDQARDEEEKYFDSETPAICTENIVHSSSEDELDIFMKNLKPEPTTDMLSEHLKQM